MSGGDSASGNVFVPQTPGNYTYDLDGNVTEEGRWTYTFDAENRLTSMQGQGITGLPTGANKKLDFEYDCQGRRISKRSYNWNGTSYVFQYERKFLYDGWNLMAEWDGPTGTLVRSFMWGMDLSGSMQGAGGVGGLLSVKPSGAAAHFAAYDGNGNVAALVDGSTGTISANYEYSPFGETIRATGSMSLTNPLRFSTTFTDDESDFLYYGYRYYSASAGRWLSRDPAESSNLYCFARNNALLLYDVLGLWESDTHQDKTTLWAKQLGIADLEAGNIGVFDIAIDTIYDPKVINNANWSWHFDRSNGSDPAADTRLKHRDEELELAKKECTNPTDSSVNAAAYLGFALHPLQDWVAHGDFNRFQETPTLTGPGTVEQRHYWHNWDAGGIQTALMTDNIIYDSGGVDGRATFLSGSLFLGTVLSNGDATYYTHFHPGNERIIATERLTKELLSNFQAYVEKYAKPCGSCRRAYLGKK